MKQYLSTILLLVLSTTSGMMPGESTAEGKAATALDILNHPNVAPIIDSFLPESLLLNLFCGINFGESSPVDRLYTKSNPKTDSSSPFLSLRESDGESSPVDRLYTKSSPKDRLALPLIREWPYSRGFICNLNKGNPWNDASAIYRATLSNFGDKGTINYKDTALAVTLSSGKDNAFKGKTVTIDNILAFFADNNQKFVVHLAAANITLVTEGGSTIHDAISHLDIMAKMGHYPKESSANTKTEVSAQIRAWVSEFKAKAGVVMENRFRYRVNSKLVDGDIIMQIVECDLNGVHDIWIKRQGDEIATIRIQGGKPILYFLRHVLPMLT